uniref:Uncharacterized protein n=1 Tax=Meloidogyne enterolobii TaxID=390850 RepID=A0A6V7U2P8_MELEN|nr:unnamed protein product [Meloidogyne enterolobii]
MIYCHNIIISFVLLLSSPSSSPCGEQHGSTNSVSVCSFFLFLSLLQNST